jgi:hypothetical protein
MPYQWRKRTMIDLSDIIHHPTFIENNVPETGLCIPRNAKRLLRWA